MGEQQVDNYLRYWGKAGYGTEAMTIHLLPYHCLDVAAVGQVFLSRNDRLRRTLAELCGLEEQLFVPCMVFFA
ncbi:MAG: HD domain-containing protein [Candidatus Latescibacterota bacterium]|jgi:CRISPR-associated endonuclease/helicase Cas3